MITYSTEGVKFPNIKKRETSNWIHNVAASYNKKIGEIGYMFVNDEKILEVNNEYLGHDYYTDIITFSATITIPISSPSTIQKEIHSMAILSSRLTLYSRMLTSSAVPTTKNCIALSSTVSCISVASTTKVLVSGKSWKPLRIRHSL